MICGVSQARAGCAELTSVSWLHDVPRFTVGCGVVSAAHLCRNSEFNDLFHLLPLGICRLWTSRSAFGIVQKLAVDVELG